MVKNLLSSIFAAKVPGYDDISFSNLQFSTNDIIEPFIRNKIQDKSRIT